MSSAVDCPFKKEVPSGLNLIPHIFNPSTQKEQGQADFEFKASLVYKLRTTQ